MLRGPFLFVTTDRFLETRLRHPDRCLIQSLDNILIYRIVRKAFTGLGQVVGSALQQYLLF